MHYYLSVFKDEKKNQKFESTNRWNNTVVAHKCRRDAEAYHKEGKSNHHFNSKKKKICNTFPYKSIIISNRKQNKNLVFLTSANLKQNCHRIPIENI